MLVKAIQKFPSLKDLIPSLNQNKIYIYPNLNGIGLGLFIFFCFLISVFYQINSGLLVSIIIFFIFFISIFVSHQNINNLEINFNKEFLGKDALQKRNVKSKCVTLLIDGPKDCDPWGREAIYKDGETIGRLTSGGYSVFFEKSIGMGYVDKVYAKIGEKLKVKMLNQLWPATIVEDSPYDQNNSKIRNR